MIDSASSESVPSRQMLQGWGASILLHILLVGALFASTPHITLVAEREPFTWDVAFVEPAQEVSSPEMPSQPHVAQPPQPVQSQPARPVEPTPDTVSASVAPQRSVQMIHPVIETPKPVESIQPAQPIVQIQPKPVEQHEIGKEEIKEPETAREVAPAIEPAVPTPTHQASAPVASPHHTERHLEPIAVASAPAVSAPEPASTQHVSSSASTAPAAVPSEPLVAAPAPSVHEQSSVVASVPVQRHATKADYAWLAESLGRRIAALTRYPSSARLNGWEGKVVLRAVIRSDGHLAGVTVQKSSGYEALDRAALETIKLACPLHMKHELSAMEVAVNVPIVYSLAN